MSPGDGRPGLRLPSAAHIKSTPPKSLGPWAYRRSGFHSFPRDPRVQQIEQQAFRHDAPEIVSRDHHLGDGVAENQLLLSEENHFAMFSHFGSLGAVRSRSIAFTTSSQGLAPIRALATLVQTGSKFEAHRSNRG